ncbi:hypothetical protein BDN72DRAFT_845208 [Pluteus cervinus]|uniref:Uncharacterized protein n=1 Tax=Pluteus cervinus TaxID=181527 RepID=A0ACD3AJI8_9AGAR|nr:hypothetical protein BDN72DRAFT_845208 [Pluteus cervinus]
MSSPRFPPELECAIFSDAAALQNPFRNPTNLFLVAKRVKEWLVPLTFEVIIVHKLRSFPIRFTNLSQFEAYGSHTHHLLLSKMWPLGTSLNPTEYLAQCPNVTNLALWWPAPPIRIESILGLSKLTHLSVDTSDYLVKAARLTQVPMFPNVTHLDILGEHATGNMEDDFAVLALHFPALTHIAFLWETELFEPVLRNFEGIKTLISCTPGVLGIDETQRAPVEDDRIVMISSSRLNDWENSARGRGPGMWEFVEEVLKKRAQEKAKKSSTRRIGDTST